MVCGIYNIVVKFQGPSMRLNKAMDIKQVIYIL